jgi:hypothetical protein
LLQPKYLDGIVYVPLYDDQKVQFSLDPYGCLCFNSDLVKGVINGEVAARDGKLRDGSGVRYADRFCLAFTPLTIYRVSVQSASDMLELQY